MHASWHLCRLQLTGDSSVENLYGSVEMLRMLMKTVGFRVRLNNSQVHFARVAVRDSPVACVQEKLSEKFEQYSPFVSCSNNFVALVELIFSILCPWYLTRYVALLNSSVKLQGDKLAVSINPLSLQKQFLNHFISLIIPVDI